MRIKTRKTMCREIGLVFAVNLLIQAGMILCMNPVYDSGKDIYIAALTNGALGVQDAHIVFQNIILGKLYCFLYGIFGARFFWYAGFQYGLLFLSFCIFTFLILRTWRGKGHIWVAMSLLLFLGYECYIQVSYVKTALVASAAGVALLSYGAYDKKKTALALGTLFTLAGSLYDFLPAVIFSILLAVILTLRMLETDRPIEEKKRSFRYAGLAFTAFLLLAGGALCVDRMAYQKEEQWQEYTSYLKVRRQLDQVTWPAYKEYKEEYQELGITESAYQLYKSGLSYDPEVLDTHKMEQLLDWIREKETMTNTLQRVQKVCMSLFDHSIFYGMVFALLVFCMNRKRGRFLTLAAGFLGIWCVLFLMVKVGGITDLPSYKALCMAGGIAFFMATSPQKQEVQRQSAVVIFLCLLLMNQNIWHTQWRINVAGEEADEAQQRVTIGNIAYDNEHLYLALGEDTLAYEQDYDVFDRINTGVWANNCRLDAWISASPVYVAIMEQYGVTNAFRDAVDNEKVYMIGGQIKTVIRYIKEYYDETAKAKKAGRVGDLTIWQIIGNGAKE